MCLIPLDLKVCTGKRRTRSFASNRDLFKVVSYVLGQSYLCEITKKPPVCIINACGMSMSHDQMSQVAE